MDVSKPAIVPKRWGRELVFANNAMYCGKVLEFKKGSKFSMHFHRNKHETWYVASGALLLKWIDTETADQHTRALSAGDVVEVQPCQPHQLVALEDASVFEVSTTHRDSDSYRVLPGDSQAK